MTEFNKKDTLDSLNDYYQSDTDSYYTSCEDQYYDSESDGEHFVSDPSYNNQNEEYDDYMKYIETSRKIIGVNKSNYRLPKPSTLKISDNNTYKMHVIKIPFMDGKHSSSTLLPIANTSSPKVIREKKTWNKVDVDINRLIDLESDEGWIKPTQRKQRKINDCKNVHRQYTKVHTMQPMQQVGVSSTEKTQRHADDTHATDTNVKPKVQKRVFKQKFHNWGSLSSSSTTIIEPRRIKNERVQDNTQDKDVKYFSEQEKYWREMFSGYRIKVIKI